jgi:peptide/nickel transport system permease protein
MPHPTGYAMLKYIIRRLLISIPVLIGITMITFTAYNLAPGDPISMMIDPSTPLPAETIQNLRRELGLNEPLPVRYVLWIRQLLKGNMGFSYASRRPVSTTIGERLPATLQLTMASLLLALVVGIPLGVYSALHQYSKLDYTLTLATFFMVSVPAFFFALGAIWIFSLRLNLFPVQGMNSAGVNTLVDRLRHLVLPATVLGLERIAGYLRYTRSAVLEVLGQDYMTTARAKGLHERAVLWGHGFRNALISLITVITLGLPGLFGGAFIIEWIFAWPGMGQLGINSVNARDYPVLMGTALIGSFLVLISNLLADVLYAVADPRIRYS